jgi:hypothetical protein
MTNFRMLSAESQTTFRQFLRFSVVFLFAGLMVAGCQNDPDEIGAGILPDDEQLTVLFSDTTTVKVHSVFSDSVSTGNTSRTMLGSYFDPVFGVNTVSFGTQVQLSTVSLDFGTNPVLDSIVLSLEYIPVSNPSGGDPVSAYGDTTTVQTIKVYQLDESIYIDSTYLSNTVVALKQPEIASFDVSFRPSDSIMVDSVKVKAQLRIPLTEEFGNSILNAPEDALESAEGFLDFMKGLYIKPVPVTAGGAIVFFDLLATSSRLTLYYHNEESESEIYPFFINEQSARYMNFDHDYSVGSTEFTEQLNGDTTLGAEKFYLQSLGGVQAVVSFPYIKDWADDQKIVINEAKLVFSNANTDSDFYPPGELVFFTLFDTGELGFLEEQFEGASYFGGTYNPAGGQYFFRITQQIQKILVNEVENTRFSMGISGASLSPNRVVLIGSNPANADQFQKRVKLNLIYTKL